MEMENTNSSTSCQEHSIKSPQNNQGHHAFWSHLSIMHYLG